MDEDWQLIETAPKDGTTIRFRRMWKGVVAFEGEAKWGHIVFPAFTDRYGTEPAWEDEGWLTLLGTRRVPEPTHWLPLTARACQTENDR